MYLDEIREHFCSLLHIIARENLTDHPHRNVVVEQPETLVGWGFLSRFLGSQHFGHCSQVMKIKCQLPVDNDKTTLWHTHP